MLDAFPWKMSSLARASRWPLDRSHCQKDNAFLRSLVPDFLLLWKALKNMSRPAWTGGLIVLILIVSFYPEWHCVHSWTKNYPTMFVGLRMIGRHENPAINSQVACTVFVSINQYFLLWCVTSWPPLGSESLNRPSETSHVLPSPPHTRHLSSLASEPSMLSQPTCWKKAQFSMPGKVWMG